MQNGSLNPSMKSTASRAKGYRVRIQQEAIDELDRLYRFILRDSKTRAAKFIQELKKTVLSLKHFPRRGTRAHILEKPEMAQEIRFLNYKGYVLFYALNKNEVLVLHVTGPGQDWVALFDV